MSPITTSPSQTVTAEKESSYKTPQDANKEQLEVTFPTTDELPPNAPLVPLVPLASRKSTLGFAADVDQAETVVKKKKRVGKTANESLGLGDDFVEGGLRGWLNVFGAFLVLLCTFGHANSFGVYQDWYTTHQYQEYSPSTISWLGSIAIWLEFSTAMLAGPLFDKGYFRQTLAVGSLTFTFGIFMVSLCKEVWQSFLCQAFLLGISMGLTYLPSITVLTHYFHRKRSFVMGVAMCGAAVGGGVFPIMLNKLFPKVGFSEAVRAAGYMIAGCLLVANLIMKPNPPKKQEGVPDHKRPSVRAILLEGRYTIAVCSAFLINIGSFFPVFYLQTFFQSQGNANKLVPYALAILFAGSIGGRVLPNILSDRIGSVTTMIMSSGLAGVLIFAMLGVNSPGGAIAFTVLYGFFSGSFFSLLGPVFVSFSNHISEAGLRQGVSLIVCGLGALIGPPLCGALLSVGDGHFKYAIAFSGSVMLVGTLGLSWARHLQVKKKGTWRV